MRDNNRSELLACYFEKVRYYTVTLKLILKDYLTKGSQTSSKLILYNILKYCIFVIVLPVGRFMYVREQVSE